MKLNKIIMAVAALLVATGINAFAADTKLAMTSIVSGDSETSVPFKAMSFDDNLNIMVVVKRDVSTANYRAIIMVDNEVETATMKKSGGDYMVSGKAEIDGMKKDTSTGGFHFGGQVHGEPLSFDIPKDKNSVNTWEFDVKGFGTGIHIDRKSNVTGLIPGADSLNKFKAAYMTAVLLMFKDGLTGADLE